MKILVINCGSSSAKYQLIDMETEEVMAKGNYERIADNAFLTHKVGSEKYKIEKNVQNHEEAIEVILEQLIHPEYGVIKDLAQIDAIGHRIVHGGEYFKESAIVTEEVIKKIDECAKLAPLHNKAAIKGIRACQKVMPEKPMVVVFDTAFHQTMEEEKYIYPIPYQYYEKYKVRKYGAHGTSHYFVSRRIAELLKKPVESLKIVNCHLGQGASLCAIKEGKCVDTSMGLTPLGGIPMCARSGDLDPSVVTYIMEQENLTPAQMQEILNKQSGVYGISGISADFRDVEAEKENKRAEISLKHYTYVVAQYIAKYAVSLGGIDVITFTAGIGENQVAIRKAICENLAFLGVKVEETANQIRGEEIRISAPDSQIEVWVVPTNEELMIARDVQRLTQK